MTLGNPKKCTLLNQTDARRRSMAFAFLGAIHALIGFSCLGHRTLELVALKLGAGEIYLGLLSFAILGLWSCRVFTMNAIERYGKRKVLIAGKSLSTFFVLPLLCVPLLAIRWPTHHVLALLFIATVLRSGSYALGNTGWFPLLQDIVPRRITGRFFAKLRVSWQTTYVVSLLCVAAFLGKESPWWKFTVVFCIGFVAYVIRVLTILPMAERKVILSNPGQRSILERFRSAFADKKMRYLIFYSTAFMIPALVVEPFKVKLLKDLGYGEGFILAVTAISGIGAICSLLFWGRIADRYGNRALFTISHVGMPIVTVLWCFVQIEQGIFVALLYFMFNVFFSGNGIAMTRYILHIASRDDQNQINISFVIRDCLTGLAPLIMGFVLSWTRYRYIPLGTLKINNYQIFFLCASILFIIPHRLSSKLDDTNDSSTLEVLDVVTRPVRNMFGYFIPLKKDKPKNKF